MIEIIITLLVIAIFSNIFNHQIDPINYLKEKIGLGYKRKVFSQIKFIDLIIYTIHKIFNCSPCLSYWITILYYQSLEGLWLGLITYTISTWLYNNVFTTKINF